MDFEGPPPRPSPPRRARDPLTLDAREFEAASPLRGIAAFALVAAGGIAVAACLFWPEPVKAVRELVRHALAEPAATR